MVATETGWTLTAEEMKGVAEVMSTLEHSARTAVGSQHIYVSEAIMAVGDQKVRVGYDEAGEFCLLGDRWPTPLCDCGWAGRGANHYHDQRMGKRPTTEETQ